MNEAERLKYARSLAGNPLITEILEQSEAACVSAFRSSKTPEEREALWARFQAIEIIRNSINVTVKRIIGSGS